jgi:hypothetical protein
MSSKFSIVVWYFEKINKITYALFLLLYYRTDISYEQVRKLEELTDSESINKYEILLSK